MPIPKFGELQLSKSFESSVRSTNEEISELTAPLARSVLESEEVSGSCLMEIGQVYLIQTTAVNALPQKPTARPSLQLAAIAS